MPQTKSKTNETAVYETENAQSLQQTADSLVEQLQGDFDNVFSAIKESREPDLEDLRITVATLMTLTEDLSSKYESD